MIALAAVNQIWLTLHLVHSASVTVRRDAMRRLRRHTMIDVSAGIVIIGIVAELGVIPPGLHKRLLPHVHHSH